MIDDDRSMELQKLSDDLQDEVDELRGQIKARDNEIQDLESRLSEKVMEIDRLDDVICGVYAKLEKMDSLCTQLMQETRP